MTPQAIVEELQRHASVELERAKVLLSSGSSNGEVDKQRKRVTAATLAYLAAKAYAKLLEQEYMARIPSYPYRVVVTTRRRTAASARAAQLRAYLALGRSDTALRRPNARLWKYCMVLDDHADHK
jgi:hypothetical protein